MRYASPYLRRRSRATALDTPGSSSTVRIAGRGAAPAVLAVIAGLPGRSTRSPGTAYGQVGQWGRAVHRRRTPGDGARGRRHLAHFGAKNPDLSSCHGKFPPCRDELSFSSSTRSRGASSTSFVAAEPHSALARILSTSRCFTSLTADHGHLSPWTTWPTLHRGVNDEQHMIANFGQNRSVADEQFPPVWELLHRAGVPVGICGTLHTYPVPADVQTYSFYLPDTFASEPTAFPAELETFQAFNLTMAKASSRNVDTAIPRGAALTLLRSAHRLGIRPGTFGALAQQLVAERRKPWLTTRRRSFQSLLAFDVFDTQLRRHRPAFSSFFSNHVASAMHRYWAAGHPADYDQLNLGEEWLAKYRGEVPWAMRRADDMIARLADFVQHNQGSELWIASSMGQGPTFRAAVGD